MKVLFSEKVRLLRRQGSFVPKWFNPGLTLCKLEYLHEFMTLSGYYRNNILKANTSIPLHC